LSVRLLTLAPPPSLAHTASSGSFDVQLLVPVLVVLLLALLDWLAAAVVLSQA
jgi:hypothetical protein